MFNQRPNIYNRFAISHLSVGIKLQSIGDSKWRQLISTVCQIYFDTLNQDSAKNLFANI